MSTFDRPITLNDGRIGYWKHSHPQRIDRLDEKGHLVVGTAMRLWVEDRIKGVETKAGHGHPRLYYCVDCAHDLGAGKPPKRYF